MKNKLLSKRKELFIDADKFKTELIKVDLRTLKPSPFQPKNRITVKRKLELEKELVDCGGMVNKIKLDKKFRIIDGHTRCQVLIDNGIFFWVVERYVNIEDDGKIFKVLNSSAVVTPAQWLSVLTKGGTAPLHILKSYKALQEVLPIRKEFNTIVNMCIEKGYGAATIHRRCGELSLRIKRKLNISVFEMMRWLLQGNNARIAKRHWTLRNLNDVLFNNALAFTVSKKKEMPLVLDVREFGK